MGDRIHICGPTPDPDDPLMEIDPARGRVPADLTAAGRSKTHEQRRDPATGLWEWHRTEGDN